MARDNFLPVRPAKEGGMVTEGGYRPAMFEGGARLELGGWGSLVREALGERRGFICWSESVSGRGSLGCENSEVSVLLFLHVRSTISTGWK